MQGAVSKAEFARIVRVTRGRVSQWIAAGQIDGEALVIEGRSERIVVEAARRQLGDRLGVDQRAPMSKARLDGVASSPIEADIKIARLRQLTLGNEKLIAEAAERAGRYVLADDARREMGKITGRMVAAFDGALPELAAAVAAQSSLPQRDALHVLRTAWRGIRERLAGAEVEAAEAAPQHLMVEAAE